MKNLLIIGDSYSTFLGYIPKENDCYYGNGREDKLPFAEFMKVEETWWAKVINALNLNLVKNESWSGAPICFTGYNSADCSKTSSFLYRFRKLCKEDFFNQNKIDTVFVFGGTNDSCANAPLGEIKKEYTEKDLYYVLPAISVLMQEINNTLPKAKVYFIINTEIKEDIVNGIKTLANKFNYGAIELKDIVKESGHPNAFGMSQIANQVIDFIKTK